MCRRVINRQMKIQNTETKHLLVAFRPCVYLFLSGNFGVFHLITNKNIAIGFNLLQLMPNQNGKLHNPATSNGENSFQQQRQQQATTTTAPLRIECLHIIFRLKHKIQPLQLMHTDHIFL